MIKSRSHNTLYRKNDENSRNTQRLNTQMSYCVKVLPRTKRTILEKLNLEPVTDNKKIRRSVKPPMSWLKIMKKQTTLN